MTGAPVLVTVIGAAVTVRRQAVTCGVTVIVVVGAATVLAATVTVRAAAVTVVGGGVEMTVTVRGLAPAGTGLADHVNGWLSSAETVVAAEGEGAAVQAAPGGQVPAPTDGWRAAQPLPRGC